MTTASFAPNTTASYSQATTNNSQLEGVFMNATQRQPLGMAASASENSTSSFAASGPTTASVLMNLITDAALGEVRTDNSTTEFPEEDVGTWTTLAILAGMILAIILIFVIILTFFLCLLQRKSRYRTVQRVENPIYRKPNDAVRTNAPLDVSPSGSLVDKSRPKSVEQTWTSKIATGFKQPKSSRDGTETSGLVEKGNHGSNESLEHVNEKPMQQRTSDIGVLNTPLLASEPDRMIGILKPPVLAPEPDRILNTPLLAPEPDRMPPVVSTLNRHQ